MRILFAYWLYSGAIILILASGLDSLFMINESVKTDHSFSSYRIFIFHLSIVMGGGFLFTAWFLAKRKLIVTVYFAMVFIFIVLVNASMDYYGNGWDV